MIGQTSQAYLGSSTALTVIFRAVQNGISGLADDGFTQLNPCAVAISGTVSRYVNPIIRGVLSGSIAFTRPDAGNDRHGGPGDPNIQTNLQKNAQYAAAFRPLGVYLNNANGNNAYDNQSATGSGLNMYVSGGGTYRNNLYETHLLADLDAANAPAKSEILYTPGAALVGSRNGFLMPQEHIGKDGVRRHVDSVSGASALTAESFIRLNTPMDSAANLLAVMQKGGPSTVIGVVKMVPDASHPGLVYDQRI